MTQLAIATCALGGLNVACGLGSLYAPDQARRAWNAFARHEVLGWVLTAVNLFWASWLVLHTPPFIGMARIEPMVYVAAPLLFFLLVVFLDEMLAARSLGGFLLLLGGPVMMAARMNESPLSMIMTLLAYGWVIVGMVLVVSPFRLRDFAQFLTHDRRRFRSGNLVVLAVGVAMLTLGLAVY